MKTLLIGERYRQKLEIALLLNGFEAFWLPENPNIDPRLASHADLSAFVYAKSFVLASFLKESELVNFLTNRGYNVLTSAKEQGSAYPGDVNLCAAVVGDILLHNEKYTDKAIKNLQLKTLHINQGYARCTVLSLNGNSIITADKGIALKAKEAGIQVLEISPGGIELEGFEEGFIGGASFVVEDTVYFTGNIKFHQDSARIVDFIEKQEMKVCCLTDAALFDIGGAVYIK